MSASEEGCFTKLAGVAAVLGVIIAYLAWRHPHVVAPPVDTPPNGPTQPLSPSPSSDEGTDSETQPVEPPIRHSNPQSPTEVPTRAAPNSAAPTEFTLGDGEQKVLLSGQATVSAQFNQIGEESFLTLYIGVGGETTPHAILTPGARFTIKVQEKLYYLSLLNLDFSSKTARIRIDRAQ